MIYALRGNKSPQVNAAHARRPLEIKGAFHAQGNQIVGTEEGMAPQWVLDLFTANPHVKQLAISFNDGGVVYSPISSENAPMEARPDSAPQ